MNGYHKPYCPLITGSGACIRIEGKDILFTAKAVDRDKFIKLL